MIDVFCSNKKLGSLFHEYTVYTALSSCERMNVTSRQRILSSLRISRNEHEDEIINIDAEEVEVVHAVISCNDFMMSGVIG